MRKQLALLVGAIVAVVVIVGVMSRRADDEDERSDPLVQFAKRESEKARREALDPIAPLLGIAPGEPGALLAPLAIDIATIVNDRFWPRAHAVEQVVHAKLAIAIGRFTLTFADADAGRALLAKRWGPGNRWLGGRIGGYPVRAQYAGAELAWEPTQTVDDLIAPRDPVKLGFEPVPLMSHRLTADVLGRMHPSVPKGPRRRTLTLPPIDWSPTPVIVALTLEDDRVAAMSIATNAPEASDAIVAALRRKLGEPGHDVVDGALEWTTAAFLRIDARREASGIVLEITTTID